MTPLRKYASFIKLEHSLFSLPLLFAGAYLAEQKWPSLRVTLLILVAGSAARVVAMSLNRIFDRNIDKQNPRTRTRHLPSGRMTTFQAWAVTGIALAIYLYSAWLISPLCLKLSWIPLIGFYVYPFFKRFTKWTHLGLGLVWAMVPLAGFLAVKPSLDSVYPAAVICLFSFLWLAGFDIIYAIADENFDREQNIFSLPAAWGTKKALYFAAILHVVAFLCLVILYFTWLSGPLTVMILGAVGILFIVEHFFSEHTNFAFFQTNVLIGFLVLIFIISGTKGL